MKQYSKFKLLLNMDWFSSKEELIQPKAIHPIFKHLGFSLKYGCKVANDPIPNGDNWEYSIQIIDTKLYWFNIKLLQWKK